MDLPEDSGSGLLAEAKAGDNAPALSVTELSMSLKRTIEMVDSSEQEILESLANTKAVAQRGLRLSKLLLRTARKRRL